MCWHYQIWCRNLTKTEILPSHSSRHLQRRFVFCKSSLEYAFDNSNTMLKLLVILFIILLFGFGPQSPMGLMYLMNRDLNLKKSKDLIQKQPLEVLYKRRCSLKNRKIHRKTPVSDSLFYQKETPEQVFSCEFLGILNNRFFYKTPLGHSFC